MQYRWLTARYRTRLGPEKILKITLSLIVRQQEDFPNLDVVDFIWGDSPRLAYPKLVIRFFSHIIVVRCMVCRTGSVYFEYCQEDNMSRYFFEHLACKEP